MTKTTNRTRDYVPRSAMNQYIAALSGRCALAEDDLKRLLDYIDEGLLVKANGDWHIAVGLILD